jgi:GT2 family glycosyltransferase/glycosyltransferase involved in cell wall biosynthesis
MIDVIIPVFRGERETRACIESVLAARNDTARELVVIDDASPEPGLGDYVRTLERNGAVTLIAHDENAGFVASVNEGLRLHPDRDVVLLNSDTEVADGWLDRLMRALHDPQVATATPYSNNATICSYPAPHLANALPPGETIASLDRAFASANAGLAIDIPTAIGFCMAIARRALDAIGLFDVARYGAGYGEEVDWCLRAARAGFRHVCAADVFVRHVGEVSFGASGAERRGHAQATIDALYPEFRERLGDFLERDPLRPARRRADLERLARSPRPRVLFTTHDRRGGVERHIEELAALTAADVEVLLLRPHRRSYVSLTWLREGESFALWFHAEREWDTLVALLRAIGITRVHIHHIHGLPQGVLGLAQSLGAGCDLTLHDYFPICPQYQMLDALGHYCNEPDAGGCRRCLEGPPPWWKLTIDQWRAAFRPLLAQARVLAPSVESARRIARYFPDARVEVWPHFETRTNESAVFKVLVPGGISPAKGFDVLVACARDAKARALPLHFRVLGYIAKPLPPWPELPLTFTGEFPEGTLASLIALERGDAFFFPVQWPETFSYTLSEALATALPIVACDLGALRERLAGRSDATLVPWDEAPARINDALIAALQDETPSHVSMPGSNVDPQDYRRRYLSAVRGTSPNSEAPWPALGDANLAAPHEDVPIPTLTELYDDGVLCGNGASARMLQDRCREADAALGQHAGEMHRARVALDRAKRDLHEANEALARSQAALGLAEAERDEAVHRNREFAASTSWRLTAPLRALARKLRRS